MNTQLFSHALSNINDKYINEALCYRKKQKNVNWLKWGAIAAGVGLTAAGVTFLFNGANRLPENNFGIGGSADGSGHDESSVFMSYAGPLFPLTTLETAEGIQAERNIDFDLSSEKWMSIIVHDAYTLTNTTDQDITVTAVYPYVSSFNTACPPTVTVDGIEADTTLHSGMYCLGDDISSWEGYKALLSDGNYMKEAFAAYPELNQPVTVYKLTDAVYNGNDPFAEAPTLSIACNIDYDKTTVMTYNFNGGIYDREKGYWNGSFFIPDDNRVSKNMEYYMIVLGDDIGEYTVQGYRNGGCHFYDKIDGASANIERYETTLGEALKTVAKVRYDERSLFSSNLPFVDGVTFDMYYGEICRSFAGQEDYWDSCFLDDILGSVEHYSRVFYSTFELTIPAGAAAKISAQMTKEASYDYYGAAGKNKGVEGYDTVTRLGSTLSFTAQSASLTNTENVEIIRQNFGFDLEKGITKVDLDLSQEHYYLEIKRIK